MSAPSSTGREAGAVLVMALIFLVAIGLVMAALVTLAGTNLLATTNLQNQRDQEAAADAAVDGAIQELRTPSASVACPTPLTHPVIVGTVTMDVQCLSQTPPGWTGRVVEFDACAASLTWTACRTSAVLRAEVTYDDQPSVGAGMDVWSWVVDPSSS